VFVIKLSRLKTLLPKETTSDVFSLFSFGRTATTLKIGGEEHKWVLSLAGWRRYRKGRSFNGRHSGLCHALSIL